MAYERKEGDGVLFKNDRKTDDRHPDYKGNALINGQEMDIGAWVKESAKTGQKFFSLSIRPKQNHGSQARSAPERGTRGGSRSIGPEDYSDFP